MPHIIVPTSTRSSSETRAERRRRDEEEHRRVRTMLSSAPTSAPAPFPTRQDSRNISTWEDIGMPVGSGPLRQEQPDAELLGWGTLGRPLAAAEKQTYGRINPLLYSVSPFYDYDRPSWTQPLGGFKFTEDPLDEVAKTSLDRFKRIGRGLTDEQIAEIPLSEQLLVEGLTDVMATGPILGGAKLLGKAPGAIKRGITARRGLGGLEQATEMVRPPSIPSTISEPGGIQPSIFDEPRGTFAPEENVFMPDDVPSKKRLTDAEDMAQERALSDIESGALDEIDDIPPIDGDGITGQGFSDEIGGGNIFTIRDVEPGLTTTQIYLNKARMALRSIQKSLEKQPVVQDIAKSVATTEKGRQILNSLQKRFPPIGVLDNPTSQAAVTEFNRVKNVVDGVADRASYYAEDIINSFKGVGDEIDEVSEGVFVVKKINGRDTAGIDSRLVDGKGQALNPTLVDIAARLPIYETYMTPDQVRAFRVLGDVIEQSRTLLDEIGNRKLTIDKERIVYLAQAMGRKVKGEVAPVVVENPLRIGSRADVEDGGFYIARGNADEADPALDTLTNDLARGKKNKRGVIQKVQREQATFSSQAAGIADGYVYAPFDTVVRNQIMKYGNEGLNTHIQNFYRSSKAADGKYLGRTPKMRMLDDPKRKQLVLKMEALRKQYRNLQAKIKNMVPEERAIIDGFLDGEYDDIEAFETALLKITARVGKYKGEGVGQLLKRFEKLNADIETFKPEYAKALKASSNVLPERGISQGSAARFGLEKLDFPEHIAQSTTKALYDRTGIPLLESAKTYNNLFRATNATLDNSALGIQGLIGLSSDLVDPKTWKSIKAGKPVEGPYAEALGVNLESWKNPDTMRAFLNTFDQRAAGNGVLSSMQWAQFGIKGGATEMTEAFASGRIGTALGKIKPVQAANRAFQHFGYSLRLGWANKSLMDEMRRTGMSVQDLVSDGTVEELAKVINNLTGHSGRRFGGSIGELVMFAPRFLQARLETLGKGSLGMLQTIPGASEIGIKGMGKVGRLRPAQRQARNSLMRLVGAGTALTFAANSLRGYPTDINPYARDKSGKLSYNPNFMRIRNALGRDWSLFGTYDSLLRAIILTADPRIGKPVPGSDLLTIAPSGAVSGLFRLTGIDYFPYPKKDEGLGDLPKIVLSEFTPFSLSELPSIAKESYGEEGLSQPDVMLRRATGLVAGEMVGAKSSPLSREDRKTFGISEGQSPGGLPFGRGRGTRGGLSKEERERLQSLR